MEKLLYLTSHLFCLNYCSFIRIEGHDFHKNTETIECEWWNVVELIFFVKNYRYRIFMGSNKKQFIFAITLSTTRVIKLCLFFFFFGSTIPFWLNQCYYTHNKFIVFVGIFISKIQLLRFIYG